MLLPDTDGRFLLSKFLDILLENLNGIYKYSSVQIQVPHQYSEAIINFGLGSIPDDQIYTDPDGTMGRENDIHCTILYGIHTSEPGEIQEYFQNQRSIMKFPIVMKLGKIGIFDRPECKVIKIDVISPELEKLNAGLRSFPHTNKFPEYHPHITIGYTKKTFDENTLDKDFFTDLGFSSNEIIFSSRSGEKYAC